MAAPHDNPFEHLLDDPHNASGEPASQFLSGAAEAAKTKRRPAPQPPSPEGILDKEGQRRDAIRQALLAQAQREYPSLVGTVQTSYSSYLQELQQRVNTDLRSESNRFHSQAVVLDPAKFDTGMAIGLNGAASVEAQLRSQGVSARPDVVTEAGQQMSTGFMTKFGSFTYMQNPTAFTNPGGAGRGACVIVPASDHAMSEEMNIRGLSTGDRVKFLNRHESWHCRDDQFSPKVIDENELKKINVDDPKSIAASAAACQTLALSYQKEAFADTAAIGSMLREGYDMSLLDKVSNWRKERPADLIHITTPVLQGLKKEIAGMGGIQKFRALSEDKAKELYYHVVDKYGVTGPGVQTALKYATGDGMQRLGHQIDAIFDKDSSKGIDFYRYFNREQGPVNERPLSPQDTAALDRYDAQGQLEERAFKLGKKVTPVTMIQAYTQMQEELRKQMKAHPEESLFPQEMIKLQRDFTQNVKNMDYVEANRRFGVKIENVEPSLAGFSDRPQRSHAPKTLHPAVKP